MTCTVVGKSIRCAAALNPGEILLLENLRFDPGEEANTPHFAEELASLADRYVNDAFSTMHRTHASICGAPQRFYERLAGFLVKRELEALDGIRIEHNKRPRLDREPHRRRWPEKAREPNHAKELIPSSPGRRLDGLDCARGSRITSNPVRPV